MKIYTILNSDGSTIETLTKPLNDNYTEKDFVETIEPLFVPQTISLLKLRMQLIISGIDLNAIDIVISQIPDVTQRALTNERWKNADYFDRNNEMLNQVATVLGLTQPQIDDIFINGNKLD